MSEKLKYSDNGQWTLTKYDVDSAIPKKTRHQKKMFGQLRTNLDTNENKMSPATSDKHHDTLTDIADSTKFGTKWHQKENKAYDKKISSK